MNPLNPRLMTTQERLATVCEILARGVIRLHLRDEQTSADAGEISLHYSPDQSGHANPNGDLT